jgi:hypothetical protein
VSDSNLLTQSRSPGNEGLVTHFLVQINFMDTFHDGNMLNESSGFSYVISEFIPKSWILAMGNMLNQSHIYAFIYTRSYTYTFI